MGPGHGTWIENDPETHLEHFTGWVPGTSDLFSKLTLIRACTVASPLLFFSPLSFKYSSLTWHSLLLKPISSQMRSYKLQG